MIEFTGNWRYICIWVAFLGCWLGTSFFFSEHTVWEIDLDSNSFEEMSQWLFYLKDSCVSSSFLKKFIALLFIVNCQTACSFYPRYVNKYRWWKPNDLNVSVSLQWTEQPWVAKKLVEAKKKLNESLNMQIECKREISIPEEFRFDSMKSFVDGFDIANYYYYSLRWDGEYHSMSDLIRTEVIGQCSMFNAQCALFTVPITRNRMESQWWSWHDMKNLLIVQWIQCATSLHMHFAKHTYNMHTY